MARPVPTLAGRRSPWLVPLLLFLAVLLAAGLAFNVANLDTGGEVIPAPPNAGGSSTSPAGFDFYAASPYIGAAFGIVMIVAFIWAWRRRKPALPEGQERSSSWWRTIQTLLAFGVFVALVVLWPHVAQQFGSNETAGSNPASGNGTMGALGGVAGIPLGVFLAGSLLVAILILFHFLHLGEALRNLAPARGGTAPVRAEAAATVDATIQELEIGADVRTAILACYQRFCRLLGQRGIVEQEPMTPREIEGLAVGRLGVAGDRAEALTSLFEEARYSVHELGDRERERALASLQALRADLEG